LIISASKVKKNLGYFGVVRIINWTQLSFGELSSVGCKLVPAKSKIEAEVEAEVKVEKEKLLNLNLKLLSTQKLQ
jgi:hypothetical protein